MTHRALTFFRLGCLVLVLTGLMHLLGHRQLATLTPLNDEEATLLKLMKSHVREDSPRAMWEFLMGFSLHFSLSVIGLGVAGGMLSLNRPTTAVAGMMFFVCAAMAVNSQAYFFAIPTACLSAAALAFLVSAVLARSASAAYPSAVKPRMGGG